MLDRNNLNNCPICGYPFKMCQCMFTGSAHPDRDRVMDYAFTHIDEYKEPQKSHLIDLKKKSGCEVKD